MLPTTGKDCALRNLPGPAQRPAAATVADALLAVEGIHCTACTQLIEMRVAALDGIAAVEANLATHRVRVQWDAAVTSLKDILGVIARAGYRAWPVAAGGQRGAASDLQQDAQRRAHRIALWRLFVAGFSMMQVMMYAFPAYLAIEGEMSADIDALLKIASFVLTAPVLLFSAAPFFSGAWRDLRACRIGMDVPVVIGITVTFAASVWATFVAPGPVYYDSVSMFVFLLLGGRYLESLARGRATAAIDELARVQPATAERLTAFPQSMATNDVAAESLCEGDHVLVRIGAAAPADGTVAQGTSLNDEALLTGESRPVEKAPGASVIGGAINLTAPLVLRVTAAGAASRLSTVVRLMEQAANRKPLLVRLADRYAGVFLSGILGLAVLGAIAWWPVDPARALWVMVAILIVTCPCALSLAAPVALSAVIGNLAQHGMLVTQGHALETLAQARHFVFDKTGTLTTGRMQVQDTLVFGRIDAVALLQLAARLEVQAVHPVAHALLMAAAPLWRGGRGGDDPQPLTTQETPGAGIEARMEGVDATEGMRVRIGSLAFAGALHGQSLPPQAAARLDMHTIAAVADEHGWLGAFALGDGIRPGAREMVSALLQSGRRVSMLSGDTLEVARRVGAALGITEVHAAMTPQQKQAHVAALQSSGAVVAMVGDGVNDTPVLAQAHLAIAIGSGAPLAQLRADMVLMSAQPSDLIHAIRIAQRTRAVVRQNIGWAAAYNLIAIPLAAAGLVTPWMAAIGMSVSSLVVVGNSMRLLGQARRAALSTQGSDSARADAPDTPPLLAEAT